MTFSAPEQTVTSTGTTEWWKYYEEKQQMKHVKNKPLQDTV